MRQRRPAEPSAVFRWTVGVGMQRVDARPVSPVFCGRRFRRGFRGGTVCSSTTPGFVDAITGSIPWSRFPGGSDHKHRGRRFARRAGSWSQVHLPYRRSERHTDGRRRSRNAAGGFRGHRHRVSRDGRSSALLRARRKSAFRGRSKPAGRPSPTASTDFSQLRHSVPATELVLGWAHNPGDFFAVLT